MNAYWDVDFYHIEEYDGEKYLRVDCWFYDNGDGGYDDDGNWNDAYSSRCEEVSGVDFLLKEFIDRFVDGDEDYTDTDEFEYRKAYIGDYTEEQAIECMNTYFNGNPPTPLPYSKLTLDTPCGCYVDAEVTV